MAIGHGGIVIPTDFHEKPERYFKVCATKCSECLFSKGRLVDAEYRRQIVKDCLTAEIAHPLDPTQTTTGRFFICHQHSWKVPHEDWEEDDRPPAPFVVCCRGFYDLYGNQLLTIQLARFWNGVVFVDPDGNPVEENT